MKIKMTSPGALFAELVVVVVGILLALGIDQAQAERADRVLESAYLVSLRDDFENTVWWTAEAGPQINSDREGNALLIAEVMGGDVEIEDSVAVAQALVRLTAVPHLRVFEATANELLATGNIRVIRSGPIRNQLVQFFDLAQTFQELERGIMSRAGEAKWALSRHLAPSVMATIAEHGWETEDLPWDRLTSESAPAGLRTAIAQSDFIDRLRRDPTVSEAITVMLDDIFLIRFQLAGLEVEARRVLQALEAEVSAGTT